MNAIKFAVLQSPQDVLDRVSPPSEVGRIPAKEILVPVRQELWIVRGTPAARDGVPRKIDVDAPFLQILAHLLVRQCGVGVSPRHRSINRQTADHALSERLLKRKR